MSEPETIGFITEDVPASVEGERISMDIGGGFGDAVQKIANLKRRTEVQVDVLTQEMGKLYRVMTQLFNQFQSAQPETLRLEEVELSVEVNGKGQVSIVGMGGEAGGKGELL